MKKFAVAFERRKFEDGRPVVAQVARIPQVGDFVQLPDRPYHAGRVNVVMLLTHPLYLEGLEIDAYLNVAEVAWGPEEFTNQKVKETPVEGQPVEGVKMMEPPPDLEEQIRRIDA